MSPRAGPLAALAALLLLGLAAPAPAADEDAAEGRTQLTAADLLRGKARQAVDLSVFAPAADARPPSHVFSGRLELRGDPHADTVHADRAFVSRADVRAARGFPQLAVDLVQDGERLLPARRGYILTPHPWWDIVLQPGRVWDEPGDAGRTRAALPFALVQKDMNCTHYGVLSFLFGDAGEISPAVMQVSSETCPYLKLDLWGELETRWVPGEVEHRAALVAADDYHRARLLPVEPLATLARAHPELRLERLAPGAAEGRTLYGLVVGDTHYVSACATRAGEYPWCDLLPLPADAVATSVLGGFGLLALEQQRRGSAARRFATLAPDGCDTEGWEDVTLTQLLDMSTGHYASPEFMVDEESEEMTALLRLAGTREKSQAACATWPRAAGPGSRWVFHGSDAWLLGTALNRLWRSVSGDAAGDVFRDLLVRDIYAPLGLAATSFSTRRTLDTGRQPFFGHGLQLERGDLVQLARFASVAGGRVGDRQVLDAELLAEALQQRPEARGMVVPGRSGVRYQHGFWARDVAQLIGCDEPVFVPFMSGSGNIVVVLFPGGVIYYGVAADGGSAPLDWGPVVAEVNKLTPLCAARD